MNISIKLSDILTEFTENKNGVFICNTILRILNKSGILASEFHSNRTITYRLFDFLSVNYPQIFKSRNEGQRGILECWFRPNFLPAMHPEMGIDEDWYHYEFGGVFSIRDDYKFKCALLKYLITTYGDYSIEFTAEELK